MNKNLLALTPLPLLLLASCRADAAEDRPNVILVVDRAPWLETVARQFAASGYGTGIVGWYEGDPGASGFDAHCIVQGNPGRSWGPTVRRNGQLTTFPDDVSTGAVLTEFLLGIAERAQDAPLLACYTPATGWPAPGATADRVFRAFSHEAATTRRTVLIAVYPISAAAGSHRVLSGVPGTEPFTESRMSTGDLLAMLRGLGGLRQPDHESPR